MIARRLLLTTPLLALLILSLSGCGGASGGGDTTVAEGGISGTGISAGTVNGFGSIIVNGSHHITDSATIVRDGAEQGDLTSFRVGEVALVEWKSDDGGITRNANRVVYESEIKGQVTGNADPGNSTVEVLGQIVNIDALTVYIDSSGNPSRLSPLDLVQGDFVEVSGFRSAGGEVRAALIELESTAGTDTSAELKGEISNLDSDSFFIGNIEVDYVSGSPVITGGILSEGLFVKVEGELVGNLVEASQIEVRDLDFAGEEGEELEIEGLVRSVAANADPAAADFTVDGVRVLTNSGTEYQNGLVTDLAVDVRLEVEGSFDESGHLIADEIEFRPSSEDVSVELEADVSGLLSTSSVKVGFGADEVIVHVNDLTQFEDKTDTIENFGLDDLMTGDHLQVRGLVDGSSGVLAIRIEREALVGDIDTDRRLQGPVIVIDPTSGSEIISILGVQIDTSGLDDDDFEPTGRTIFFNALDDGDVVQADGSDDGTGLQWDGLEIED